MASKRELRQKKRKNPFVPRPGQHVLVPSYLAGVHKDDEQFEAYVLEVTRPQGVIGGTVRYVDAQFHKLPDGGMHWWPARDMEEVMTARGGHSYVSARPEPSAGARLLAQGELFDDTSPSTTGTTRRRRRRRKPTSTTTEPTQTTTRRRRRRRASAAAQSTEGAGTSSAEKNSLQTDGQAGKLPAGQRRKRRSTNPQTTHRRTSMARRTTKAATAEPEPATTGRKRGRKTTATAEPEPAKASNGSSNRRTHEDIVALVPEIVQHLKNGVTMTEIRLGGDTVGSEGYGAGPVIRKALTEAGYNTKGEKIERPDLTELEGKKLADAVAELRNDGKAWYYIELAADMSQDDLKDLLEENGYGELASGRVILSGEEEEEAPAPAKRGRGRKTAAAAEPEAAAPATTGRRRGRKTAAAEPEPEPAATGGRRRGRRQAANPS